MQAQLQAAADRVCNEEIENSAGAEKAARAVGVIARSACAVDVLRQRARAASEEDEMGGRTYDPDEDECIRQELLVESARIERIFEGKSAGRSEWRAAEAGEALAGDTGPPAVP
ncbi:hypothetical protein [Brevundimonas sp.]|uniref:hypothetical protein n=1 Tax=Brevundimonas sp. TaxID=1871086 RepID=UPI0037BF6FEC